MPDNKVHSIFICYAKNVIGNDNCISTKGKMEAIRLDVVEVLEKQKDYVRSYLGTWLKTQ